MIPMTLKNTYLATHEHGKSVVRVEPSWSKFLRFVESDNVPEINRDCDSSRTGSTDFTGTKSWDEAIQLAEYGDPKIVAQTSVDVRALGTTLADSVKDVRRINQWSRSGGTPSVGRALSGNPMAMRRRVRQASGQAQVIRIYVNASAPGRIEASTLMGRAKAIAAMGDVIRKAGLPVEVWAALDAESSFHAVRVVQPGESVDLSKMAFTLGHPSMLRRLFFAALERETVQCDSWYGTPVSEPSKVMYDMIDPTIIVNTSPNEWDKMARASFDWEAWCRTQMAPILAS